MKASPVLAVCLLDYSIEADFSASQRYARMIVEKVLNGKQHDKHLCLNVNFPAVTEKLIKGVKVCRQAYAKYEEDFIERNDPHGRKYYWLTGEFVNFDKGRDTDVWALANNYVSIVPVQFDMTNYVLKNKFEKEWQHLSLKKDNLKLGMIMASDDSRCPIPCLPAPCPVDSQARHR